MVNRFGEIFSFNTVLFLDFFFFHFNDIVFSFGFLAPGTYDIEKAEKVIHQSPGAVTFGIKYKEPKPDEIPGKK